MSEAPVCLGGVSQENANDIKAAAATSAALLFLRLWSEVKWLHWTTHSYSAHRALDGLDAELRAAADRWVEAAQGKYGRVGLWRRDGRRETRRASAADGVTDFPRQARWSEEMQFAWKRLLRAENDLRALRDEHFSGPEDTELSSLMDEVFVSLSRARYLTTLA